MTEFWALAVGETITFANCYRRNPKWRWWKFWLPKHLGELQTFVVTERSRG